MAVRQLSRIDRVERIVELFLHLLPTARADGSVGEIVLEPVTVRIFGNPLDRQRPAALDLPIRPSYWDFQTRVEYDLDRDNRVTFVGIGAIDDFDIVEVEPDDTIENQDLAASVLDNDQRTYTVGATWRRLVPRLAQ